MILTRQTAETAAIPTSRAEGSRQLRHRLEVHPTDARHVVVPHRIVYSFLREGRRLIGKLALSERVAVSSNGYVGAAAKHQPQLVWVVCTARGALTS